MRYWTSDTGGLWRLGPDGGFYLDAAGRWQPSPTACDAAAGYNIDLDEITPEQAAGIADRMTSTRA